MDAIFECSAYANAKHCMVIRHNYGVNLLLIFIAEGLYLKVPKFSDARKLCCNESKGPNLRVFRLKDANGIANSEDPGQTARGAV